MEVAGIEPASEALPDCRNYNHVAIMGATAPNFKEYGIRDHRMRARTDDATSTRPRTLITLNPLGDTIDEIAP